MPERLPLVVTDTGEELLSGNNKGKIESLPVGDTLPKSIVGLAEVDNTSDLDKPVSDAVAAALLVLTQALDGKVSSLTAGTGISIDLTDPTAPVITNTGGVGGGTSDHGALTGNADDDHTQYHTDARGDARYYTKTASDTALGLKAAQTEVDTISTAVTTLQTLVSSDDTTLDDLQKIVDFIKINKSTLDALSIASIAGLQTALEGKLDSAHGAAVDNPHGVTATQVGLGNVDNTSDTAKPVSTAQAAINTAMNTALSNLQTLVNSDDATLDDLQEIVDFIKINKSTLDTLGIASIAGLQAALDGKLGSAHGTATDNPHGVTAAQVGLGNANNTSDASKPVSNAQAAAIDAIVPGTQDLGNVAGATNLDLAAGVGITATVTGDTAFTFINAPVGKVNSVLLTLVNGAAHAVTFVDTIEWDGGVQPTLQASGKDKLAFVSVGAGWAGSLVWSTGSATMEVATIALDSYFANLSGTDPAVAGKPWNDTGTVKISAG